MSNNVFQRLKRKNVKIYILLLAGGPLKCFGLFPSVLKVEGSKVVLFFGFMAQG